MAQDLYILLRDTLARQPEPPTRAELRYVTWTETGAKAAQVVVRYGGDAQRPAANERVYPSLQFRSEQLAGAGLADTVLNRLRQVMGELGSHRHGVRREGTASRWPYEQFVLSFNGHGRPGEEHKPLVAFGQPPFVRADQALREWFEGDVPYVGECNILIDDPRGRILSAEQDGMNLAIRVLRGDANEPLEIQAAFSDAAGSRIDGGHWTLPGDDTVTISPPAAAYSAELFLVKSTNAILDRRSVDVSWSRLSPEALADRQAVAERDARGGENEMVELKPWLPQMHAKESEIVKSLVAFGNGREPSRLYIGVDDDGHVEGWGAFNKARPGTLPTDAEAALGLWLRKLVETRIRNPPAVDARLVEVDGGPVFSVLVRPSAARPCMTIENDVWIRRGANNRRPEPEQLRALTSAGATEVRPEIAEAMNTAR